MATLEVKNLSGQKVGSIELADEIFNAPVKEHLLWEVVVAQLASRRRGTACTKTRSEVAGSTKKIYRQKGTGRARHGSIRANIFVGGGNVHGPKPRDYRYEPPKKVRRSALCSAISLRNAEKKLVILQDLNLSEIKTKKMAQVLSKLGLKGGVFVDQNGNVQLIKSVRNLAHSKYIAPEGLNVYDILRYEGLVLTAPVAKMIEERLRP